MKLLKESQRKSAQVSLILLDWTVRESFHLLHYLKQQTVPRDQFEVILIEYHSTVSEPLKQFEEEVDTWMLLEMPEDCYYHKHLMYNAGIVVANGEIAVICDSDAMVKPTFIQTIIEEFEANPDQVLHLDQFRSHRRDMYPFNYPSFEEVLGEGCINRAGDVTTGLASHADGIHTRNYGACMCARRDRMIQIGGADEHIDFLGHVCGPYDLTFRLVNDGCTAHWHEREFMFHTWHPGSDGVDNYLGPHDGKNISTTSFEAIFTGRTRPHQENLAIRQLRKNPEMDRKLALESLIQSESRREWRIERLDDLYHAGALSEIRPLGEGQLYRGYRVVRDDDGFLATPLVIGSLPSSGDSRVDPPYSFRGESLEEVKQQVDWRARRLRRFRQVLAIPVFVLFSPRWILRRTGLNRVLRRWAESLFQAYRSFLGAQRHSTKFHQLVVKLFLGFQGFRQRLGEILAPYESAFHAERNDLVMSSLLNLSVVREAIRDGVMQSPRCVVTSPILPLSFMMAMRSFKKVPNAPLLSHPTQEELESLLSSEQEESTSGELLLQTWVVLHYYSYLSSRSDFLKIRVF